MPQLERKHIGDNTDYSVTTAYSRSGPAAYFLHRKVPGKMPRTSQTGSPDANEKKKLQRHPAPENAFPKRSSTCPRLLTTLKSWGVITVASPRKRLREECRVDRKVLSWKGVLNAATSPAKVKSSCTGSNNKRILFKPLNPQPLNPYLFMDVYKQIIIMNPKKVGSLGSR